MVRTTVLGIAAAGILLVRGCGCTAPPRVADTSRPTTASTRIPPPAPPAGGVTPPPPGGGVVNGTCLLANAAFCETFDAPHNGGTRTGDLDPVLWGVSRIGNILPGLHINDVGNVSVSGCGSTALAFPPNDVRVCNGKMFETVNDGGGSANLDTYPKQPFNFANRTGVAVFDVSADSDGSHGAWPEFVITDKPVPGTRVGISNLSPAAAANEVGFSLDGCSSGPGGTTGVGKIFVTKANVYSEPAFTPTGCVNKGTANALNHFEVRISQNHLEVWGTNPGGGALVQLAVADNLGLALSQGLVWLNDTHYNARKAVEPCACGTQFNHTFVWDNLGFDGPKTYRDLGFDVPDPGVPGSPLEAGDASIRTGFQIGNGPTALPINGVAWNQPLPTGAQVVFNSYSFAPLIPSIQINGGPWIDTAWPYGSEGGYSWRSISVPLPNAQFGAGAGQIHAGSNTIVFKSTDGSTVVSNISLILVAGAAVP